jgi:NADPH-dependent ferric siderophore reductase
LRAGVKVGLSAFKKRDTALIRATDRPKVGDSLDLDAAMLAEFPQQNRWDYVLSVPQKAELVAIEPHSAKDSEINVLVRKKRQAGEYLRAHLPPSKRPARWVWVSHGRVCFSRMERARRQLAQNGISFEGHELGL